jgi:hypothetical protein
MQPELGRIQEALTGDALAKRVLIEVDQMDFIISREQRSRGDFLRSNAMTLLRWSAKASQ